MGGEDCTCSGLSRFQRTLHTHSDSHRELLHEPIPQGILDKVVRNHRKTTRHTTGLFQCRGSITCNWSETGLTRWLQGGGTGSGRPGRSAKQGPHGAYHTSRLRDSGWSQPGHTVRCPDAGTGEQGPVPTGTCSVHTGYCVCPCVPCVPYVSRLPPVSFYRQLMLATGHIIL